MATQAEQEESHAQSRTDLSSPSPESSLSWCLVQLNKSSPRLDALPGDDPRPSREADKRLRAGQWRALVAIRTHHIKGGSSRIGRYQAQGGLPPLLTVLRRPESSRKVLDLTLSILANCCTEKETRGEVRRLGGVSLIVEVLKRHASVETVENRAARALGNLAMDPEGSAQIHSAGGVPPLLLCLSLSSSPSSPPSPSIISPPPASSSMLERAQSAARAFLYLSDTPSNRLSLLSRGALPALGVFLAPEYPLGLRRTCLRALHELTRGCGTECAREVSVSGVLSHLGPLASGDAGGALEELALKTLANLCSQGCLRPLVGSLGVIRKFTEEAKKDPLKSSALFKALCLCCKEAVNRAKVKESGGLEVLIGFLSGYRNHPFTRLAVLACVDFVYDEAALEHLQELGLVPLLVARLVDLARGDDSKMDAGLSASSQCSELSSCFDSFDFPPPEGSRKEEVGKEQGSSSFLSLRSWLLSEGFISSEVELMNSPCCSDGDSGSPHLTCSPSSSSSSSPSPADVCPSPSQQKPVSYPSSRLKPCRLSVSTSPASPCPPPPPPPSCTSTPQPKPPASPCKVSSPPRKRARTCSLSSSASRLSRVSLDAPKTPTYQHPYHPEPWAPESPVLLLLSRFSHAADPSGALITAPVISALLYYLTWHREPSGRCCRMLVRITCNPNCLQPLVRTGAVALIRHRLCLRDRARPGETDRQLDRVKAKISQLGEGLLDNLRVQSETGFGSGVLTHVVLSGSENDKLHCALCLPLIVSNRVLLKKLLLDSGGLLSALEPLVWLGGAEDEDNGADKCSTFLSAWICPSEQVCASRYCTLYASLLIGCLSSLRVGSKVEPDRPGALEDQWQDLGSSSCSCSYQTSNHDLNFLLDDGSLLPANRGTVSGELGVAEAESEYFRALLRGRFDEARRSDRDAVRIRDVSCGMLLPVLHYLHGCRMTGDGAGRCLVLSSLVSGGLTGHAEFQKTPLAEVMMGASRFLVPGLQSTSEDLCMSLLSSLASGTDSQRGPSHLPGAQERHRAHVASSADTDREGDAVCAFLPQAYWFSQRYSYSRLGMSCLSILLRPHMPPSVSSDCLLRLVQQADSTESLRQDLLSLAAAALS